MTMLRVTLTVLACLMAATASAQRSNNNAPSLAGAQMGTHTNLQNNGSASLGRQLRHTGTTLTQNTKPKADGKK